ncbi:MAG: hypothetical protein GXO78_04080 [Calditrichaeota bacterium]|nr:hypothetical protein [Calditrichota bacterium]
MAKKGYQGSIILELLIVLLALLLVAVILIPDKIWKEEEFLTKTCRYNINAIYEAERYYFRMNEAYTDSLQKLVTFIQGDSSLQTRNKIVQLTRSLYSVIQNVLGNPTIREVATLSSALAEIQGDLRANERYFRKYEEILNEKDAISTDISRVDNSALFANFSYLKNYVDSLTNLKSNISNYTLQNAALYAKKYVDSISVYLPLIERAAVYEYWSQLYSRIDAFVKAVEKTDIVRVSSVSDRLKKFLARGDNAIKRLMATELQQSVNHLNDIAGNIQSVYDTYVSPGMFSISQRRGLLKLSEVDSILLTFNESNFMCPDNHKPYIVVVRGGHLTIECPNLLDEFQQQLQQAVEPVTNLSVFHYMSEIDTVLDSTYQTMDQVRPFIRRYTDILLDMKELMAELQGFNVSSYQYAREVKDFVDTVKVEKRLSVLKPMIEDILNPMDTLATRLETHNFSDLEEKMDYLGSKIQKLDSLIENTKLPRRVRAKVVKFYPSFEPVFDILNQLKSAGDSQEAQQLRVAAQAIEKSLVEVLNGYRERMYVIFYKKHINHGYIKDRLKSWEQE